MFFITSRKVQSGLPDVQILFYLLILNKVAWIKNNESNTEALAKFVLFSDTFIESCVLSLFRLPSWTTKK